MACGEQNWREGGRRVTLPAVPSRPSADPPPPIRYDDQAPHFDERAGIPPDAAEAAARVLAELAGPVDGQTWLDVGAGTGALTLPLLRLPLRCIALDRAPAMLSVFREKAVEEGQRPALVVADGNAAWPLADGSVDLVLSARALHHLDATHAVAEVQRVIRRTGGWLAVARVERPRDSVKQVMRREMRRLLGAEGRSGRSHRARADGVFAALDASGGRRLEPRTVARWTHLHRPADSIAAWAAKEGLAGIDVPAEVKARILATLRDFAAAEFGDPDRPVAQEETLEIEAMRLPQRQGGEMT